MVLKSSRNWYVPSSHNRFSLFVDTQMLVAADSKLAGCFEQVASTKNLVV